MVSLFVGCARLWEGWKWWSGREGSSDRRSSSSWCRGCGCDGREGLLCGDKGGEEESSGEDSGFWTSLNLRFRELEV